MLNHFVKKPKNLFLLDSLGAMLTAFFLFVVLSNCNGYFGMPKTKLTYLSAIAICYCLYSATCFFFLKENWTTFITVIAVANILFCTLTMGFVIRYYNQLTTIGLAYFLAEIIIICILVFIEGTVVTKIKKIE